MKLRLIVVTALAAVGLLAGVPASVAAAPHVRFGLIVFNPKGWDYPVTNTKLNNERAKIYNPRRSAVELEGFTVRDGDGNLYTFGRFRLGPGRKVWLHTGRGTDTRRHVFWGRGDYVWDNDADIARLRNAAGALRDTCEWSGETGAVMGIAC
jgi:hypothetical protein